VVFDLFRQATPVLLGVDISPASVKLLELTKTNNGYRIESFGVAPLPSNTLVEKVVKNPRGLTQAVRSLINKINPKTKNVAIAIPDSLAITKVIQLDASLNDADIENQIAIEAEKYIPYPLQEINLDFSVLGPSAKDKRQIDVLLAAARTENIMTTVEALTEAGLQVKIVDVQAYSVERASQLLKSQLPDGGKDKVVAMVDIGAATTHLTILDNFKAVYSREEPFGGQQLTESIQQRYALSQSEAGLAKKQGGLPDDYQTAILDPFRETLTLQLRRALQFFFSASQYSEIHAIILAGGTSKVIGLAKLMEEQLGVPTCIANPLAKMTFAAAVDSVTLMHESSSLLVACGLAMRSIQYG
jgi:type IV pilus assembly protein PilM